MQFESSLNSHPQSQEKKLISKRILAKEKSRGRLEQTEILKKKKKKLIATANIQPLPEYSLMWFSSWGWLVINEKFELAVILLSFFTDLVSCRCTNTYTHTISFLLFFTFYLLFSAFFSSSKAFPDFAHFSLVINEFFTKWKINKREGKAYGSVDPILSHITT